MTAWQHQQIGLGVSRYPIDTDPARLPGPPRVRVPDVHGHAEVRPHNGKLARIGLRWASEIGINSLFLYEPGYNPIRLHLTHRAATRRAHRYNAKATP